MFAFCPARIFTRQHKKHVNLIRTKTVYGIEIPGGIYQLQKKRNGISNQKCPDYLKNKNIDVIIPKNCSNIHQKLLRLHDIEKKHVQKVDWLCYKGYTKNIDTFDRTLAYISKHEKPSINLELFSCVSFEWNDGRLMKTSDSKEESNEEEYEINSVNTSHPVFSSKEYRPVYYSFEQTITALRNMSMVDGVKALNQTVPHLLSQSLGVHDVKLSNPFIVVEGLDGTGKSTMTKNLCKHFNAIQMATPPDLIRQLRKKFDHLPELCRRSYYSFSNYMASKDVIDVTSSQPVVMDRYWHSTTAYAIAKDAAIGIAEHIPDKGDSLFAWPDDLLRPTVVLFLTTHEKHRDERVNERGDEVTVEEQEISESERFRMRIMEVYRRIGYTKWVEVDTSGTQEESLQKAVEGLADKRVTL